MKDAKMKKNKKLETEKEKKKELTKMMEEKGGID